MPTSYRLTQVRYQHTAFSGIGPMQRNGRWHRSGIPVVYTAESSALALLEIMVHIDRARLLTMAFVELSCHFPGELTEPATRYAEGDTLPEDWNAFPWSRASQELGVAWFEAGRSAVLEVPSAVVPSATNYLINPRHPDFEKLEISDPRPLEVDVRLGR